MDPEHLKTKEWREISEFPIFRANILSVVTDEVHLINEWGTNFRIDFTIIGLFVRGRLPVSTSIVGLSATLAPGNDTTAICKSLGLFDGQFHMIRRTNERPNIQFSLSYPTDSLVTNFPTSSHSCRVVANLLFISIHSTCSSVATSTSGAYNPLLQTKCDERACTTASVHRNITKKPFAASTRIQNVRSCWQPLRSQMESTQNPSSIAYL